MFPIIGKGGKADFDKDAHEPPGRLPSPVRDVVAERAGTRCRRPGLFAQSELGKTGGASLSIAQGIGVPEGVEPDVRFFHESGPVPDGQLLATYLGAEAGVEYIFDRGVALTDGGLGVREFPVGDIRGSLLQHVEWVVSRIRAAPSSLPAP
jgi:hypothetical protein